jgi:hypothetical protein
MPIYKFFCDKCDDDFESVQSIGGSGRKTLKELKAQPKRMAKCPTCENVSTKLVFSHQIYFVGASVESAEYNPAFGQVVKNSRHRKDLAKEKGMIEIGNEKPESLHKKFEKDRAEKLKKSWDDI